MGKYSVGDRVEVTIVGNVTRTVSSAGSSTEYLSLNDDVHVFTGTPGIQVRKLAPPKPKVGEVIDADRLKATPWRTGTMFEQVDGYLGWVGDRYVLIANGTLINIGAGGLDQGGHPFHFSDFGHAEHVKVVYLP